MWAPFSDAAISAPSVPNRRSVTAGSSPFRARARPIKDFRETQFVEFIQSSKQRIVLLEALAKAKARIERNPIMLDSCCNRSVRAFAKLFFDQHNNLRHRRERPPFIWAPTGVHQDHAAFQLGESRRHLRVPFQ